MAFPRRMVIAHLGSGCSVTAVVDGRSVDTTMGLTPTGGVVMGTRPGDLDPGLVLYLLRQMKGDGGCGAVEKMLNHDSGMVALTGLPNDMKAVRKAAAERRCTGSAGGGGVYAEREEGDRGICGADGWVGCDCFCGWDWGA